MTQDHFLMTWESHWSPLFTSAVTFTNIVPRTRNDFLQRKSEKKTSRKPHWVCSCSSCRRWKKSFIIIFFSHIPQHSIQNITKQNNRHILNISKSSQKGGREGRTTKTQKSLLHTITYIKQKTLPSINGRRPGPTDSRRCTFTSHYLQEATDPICCSTHVWCKPVLYYCLLRSCKTSKQHSLLHWTYTETRIIIKKTQTWVSKPINYQ